MNAPFFSRVSGFVRVVLLLAAAAFLFPLVGCEEARQAHDLGGLATSSLSAEAQAAARRQVEPYKAGDCSDDALRVATQILAEANAAAPTSAQARAVQALMAERIVPYNSEPTSPALQKSPELRAQTSILFDQMNERMTAGLPDLTTVIVWAKAGVALDRRSDINATILRAAGDPQLRDVLRKDDPTRDRLWSYATDADQGGGSRAVLYRGHDFSVKDVADGVVTIVALPLLIILLALGGDWCC